MKKILFIDDDPVFHYIYDKIIKSLGIDCDVRMVFNGKDALDILSSYRHNIFVPDYIFVDLNMPIMDGFGFIQQFRALEVAGMENITIIVLTSSDNCTDRDQAAVLGIENYILKPLEICDLSRILKYG